MLDALWPLMLILPFFPFHAWAKGAFLRRSEPIFLLTYDESRIGFVETIVEFMGLLIGLAFFSRSKIRFLVLACVGVTQLPALCLCFPWSFRAIHPLDYSLTGFSLVWF